MKGITILSRSTLIVATGLLTFTAVQTARAQNTVQAGLMACVNNNGGYIDGTLDSVYVTAVFNTNAYIQDSTGGVYLYKAGSSTQGIQGLTVGTQITGLGSGGFYFYGTGQQFEYEPSSSSTAYTYTGILTGTAASIPASYYASLTLSTFNSAAAQGSASDPGMQNRLVTLSNVIISNAGGTFAAGAYTLTDPNGSTAVLYVNAASGIVGTTIPFGATNVSGVFQNYRGTSELLPRGAYDLAAVPEPSALAALAFGGLGLLAFRFRAHHPRFVDDQAGAARTATVPGCS